LEAIMVEVRLRARAPREIYRTESMSAAAGEKSSTSPFR
jgi:hypothetical protein